MNSVWLHWRRTLVRYNFVESSIDFMNATTHKLNAEKHLAEVCVISTINAIGIINVIRKIK
jgi:hypothetical protein